ncbi:MAG: sigma-70 family RNA polymerase sigma factor [Clostridia bacterium]|nr:sigma-70 family RNA polymerase sigma factor [Clostridia bacterium]
MEDEALINLALSGDEKSLEELLKRYKKMVLSITRKFSLYGFESEDLVQEGMCGLYAAIIGFKKGQQAKFSTYAYSCVKNRIIDLAKKHAKQNQRTGGEEQLIKKKGKWEEVDFEQILDKSDGPEIKLIKKESSSEFLLKISKILSSLEYRVIVAYMDGLTLTEIAQALNKSKKSVDNALTRSKKKIEKLFREE